MRSDGLRISKTAATFSGSGSGYDSTHSYMRGYVLDITRKTGVLMRQSLRTAAAALARLDAEATAGTAEGLWQLLPAAVRQPASTQDGATPRAPVAKAITA